MLLKDSRPKVIENLITDNDGIGLFIRDKSCGIYEGNIVNKYEIIYKIYKIKNKKIKSNEIELVMEKYNKKLEDITNEK
jgi:F-box protein 11